MESLDEGEGLTYIARRCSSFYIKCRRLAFPDFQSGCNVDLQLSPRNLVKLKSEELGIDDDRVAERERGG